jgi:transcriptional regulator with XRE-family HTH domain
MRQHKFSDFVFVIMVKPLPEVDRLAVGARIQKARKATGLTQATLGERLGVIQSVVSDWERGRLESWRDYLPELARALGVNPSALLPDAASNQSLSWGERLVGGAPILQMLSIRFRTQAGAWLDADMYATQDYGEGPIPADPRIAPQHQWLEEVVGESMDLIIKPGSLIHVIDAISLEYSPRQDDIVVIERIRHQGSQIERSVKQVQITRAGPEFWGRSSNPIWNVPVKLGEGLDEDETAEVRIAGWVRHAIQKF